MFAVAPLSLNKLTRAIPKLVKPFRSAGIVKEIYKSSYFLRNLYNAFTNFVLFATSAYPAPSISKSNALTFVLINNSSKTLYNSSSEYNVYIYGDVAPPNEIITYPPTF